MVRGMTRIRVVLPDRAISPLKKKNRKEKCNISPHHEDISMGKVDQSEYPVHQGVPQGDEGVETAPLQRIE